MICETRVCVHSFDLQRDLKHDTHHRAVTFRIHKMHLIQLITQFRLGLMKMKPKNNFLCSSQTLNVFCLRLNISDA